MVMSMKPVNYQTHFCLEIKETILYRLNYNKYVIDPDSGVVWAQSYKKKGGGAYSKSGR